MIIIDGQAKIALAALVHCQIDTPYYSGSLEIMLLSSLICDLDLGNIDGVSDIPYQRDVKPRRNTFGGFMCA